MKSSSAIWLAAIAVAATVCGGVAAKAEQYRVVPSESGTICEFGTKSEPVVIEGRDVVTVAPPEAINPAAGRHLNPAGGGHLEHGGLRR